MAELKAAIRRGDVLALESLLPAAELADANLHRGADSPLCIAVHTGDVHAVVELLQLGARVTEEVKAALAGATLAVLVAAGTWAHIHGMDGVVAAWLAAFAHGEDRQWLLQLRALCATATLQPPAEVMRSQRPCSPETMAWLRKSGGSRHCRASRPALVTWPSYVPWHALGSTYTSAVTH
jgi:hypothetical protein